MIFFLEAMVYVAPGSGQRKYILQHVFLLSFKFNDVIVRARSCTMVLHEGNELIETRPSVIVAVLTWIAVETSQEQR